MFVYGCVQYWCKTLYRTWFAELSPRKRAELPSFAIALIHHSVAVPFSIYHIYMDIFHYGDVNYGELYSIIVPFTMGFFIADLMMYTVPEAMEGRYIYLLHHIFAVVLLIGAFKADASVVRFMPHMLLMELSSLLFALAWFLRLFGYRGSLAVVACEYLFVLVYLFVRIIHVPCYLFFIIDHLPSMGICGLFFLPVILLQVYWFSQILMTLSGRTMGGQITEKKKEWGRDRIWHVVLALKYSENFERDKNNLHSTAKESTRSHCLLRFKQIHHVTS